MKLLANSYIDIDNKKIYLKIYKLYKSFLLLIADQEEMGIGNVTLGSPSMVKGIKSPTVSYNLFGMTNKLLSTIISEKTSNLLNAPVLLLLFLKNKEIDSKFIKPIINFLNEVLNQIIKDIESEPD
ncbi:hypothetical protein LCGC14_0438610 [marine sediment metagenome]|uniref:Proteasome assembly chaperone 3 n=1 Tax=marine sediment metagenome TaxID=412755 RepID=A0A0F9V7Z5_9ZZZZ|nr:hypothetical protein [archaeon]